MINIQRNPSGAPDGCGKAVFGLISAICIAIWQGFTYICECIKYFFVSLASLIGFGAPVDLDMPKIVNTDENTNSVEVSWEPVQHADYYILHFNELKKTPSSDDEYFMSMDDEDYDFSYKPRYTSNTKNEEDIIVKDGTSVILERDYFDIKKSPSSTKHILQQK